MPSIDLQFLSISSLATLLKQKKLSPLEVTEACFARIDAIDATINSFITQTRDLAFQQAKRAEQELARGVGRGPLHGVPIALKDLYATKGIRTTAHSKVLQDCLPSEDATVTSLLDQAGTVLLGKLAMHEFAYGSPTFDTPFPPARNPWDPEHVPGGSSSGSGAALAAGLCFGALGSDTGGSIRNPASYCGIVGLKPTYGRVSRAGVVPLSWSLDHAGPMARTVEDCALMLKAIAGFDPKDPASANVPVDDYCAKLHDGVKGLRLAVPRQWFGEGKGCEPEVIAAFDAALVVLQDLGATVTVVDAEPFVRARAANTLILSAEAFAYHEETLRSRPEDFSADLRNRFREGALLSAADYIQAQRARTVIVGQLTGILRECDAILSPTTPRPAETFAESDPNARYERPSFTNPFNLTGLPAISVPCGFSSAGLPIGLQIAGRAFDEVTVLRIASAYERETDWHDRHPVL